MEVYDEAEILPQAENNYLLTSSDGKMEQTFKDEKIEVAKASDLSEINTLETMTEQSMDCSRIDIKGSSRGYMLWRTLKNMRKYVSKVSEPMTKGRRRSLRRQLSFQVDDLERIMLGVKPCEEEKENSDASEVGEDEEMRGEVEAIIKDTLDEASSAGKVVTTDHFENRMRLVEKECAELKKNMEELSRQSRQDPKRKKLEKARGSFMIQKSPLKLGSSPLKSGSFMVQKSPHKSTKPDYGPDDYGHEGSLDFTTEQDDSFKTKKERGLCSVCGKVQVLAGWRCISCRNFWNRLIRMHTKGKLLPQCDHWESTVVCKGCRRRKYEAAMAIHCPTTPLGVPPCPPPSCPVDAYLFKEEQSRELRIEYW